MDLAPPLLPARSLVRLLGRASLARLLGRATLLLRKETSPRETGAPTPLLIREPGPGLAPGSILPLPLFKPEAFLLPAVPASNLFKNDSLSSTRATPPALTLPNVKGPNFTLARRLTVRHRYLQILRICRFCRGHA